MFSLKEMIKEKTWWFSLLFITLVAILNATIPLATSHILNASLAKEIPSLARWIVLIIVNILLLLLFESFSQYFSVKFQNQMRLKMTTRISDALSKQHAEQFTSKDKSYYVNLYNNTIQTLEEDYYKKCLAVYQGIIGIMSNIFVLFLLDRVLLIVVLVTSCIPLIIPLISKNKLSMLKEKIADSNTHFNRKLADFLEGFLVSRTFNSQHIILKRLTKSTEEVNHAKEKYEKHDVLLNMLSGLSFYVSFISILIIGALRISRDLTTVGALTGSIQISDNLIYPIRLVSEELRTLLSTKELRVGINNLILTDSMENLSFEQTNVLQSDDVMVSINNLSLVLGEKVLFDDISYQFLRHKKYAIIGESGVGKSTLLKIINGDIYPNSGTVLKNPNMQIRMVYQTPYLFYDTLQDNLTMFGQFTQKETLTQWKTRMNLVVSESSESNYSGGEVQKISLVRALQSQPDCLILDEATSSLDEINYQFVEKNILTHYEGTLIAVSHRLTEDLKSLYDTVLVLQNGKLIEINN